MKKISNIILTFATVMLLAVPVSAQDRHNDRHHDNNNNNNNWHRTHYNDEDSERGVPFKWHSNYNSIRVHNRIERIHDREWDHRFPGLQVYSWSDHRGFWHHGHYVQEAVLFFNSDHELVSIGYMADGVFIHFRADHESYENNDPFFHERWHR